MMDIAYPATFPPRMQIYTLYQPNSFKLAVPPPPSGIDL